MATRLVSFGLDPSKLTQSGRRCCIAADAPSGFVGARTILLGPCPRRLIPATHSQCVSTT